MSEHDTSSAINTKLHAQFFLRTKC